MISRNGFEASSHWHLYSANHGALSLRWLKLDNGSYQARLQQYRSVVDRHMKSAERVFPPEEAYERIISVTGRAISEHIERQLVSHEVAKVVYRVVTLPDGLNPFQLQMGKGAGGSAYAFATKSVPGRILIASTPETRYDESKKAEFIELQSQADAWVEVALSRPLTEVASTEGPGWVAKALSKIMPEEPSYAA